jgi:hypothetical protein
MSRAYYDNSFLVKLYYREAGSAGIRHIPE